MSEALLFKLFPIVFALMWIMISGIISSTSGWKELADIYSNKLEGKKRICKYYFQSFRFKEYATYSGAVNVTIFEDGILLTPVILFRFFHKPFFLPWTEINAITINKKRFYNKTYFKINDIDITIYGSLLEYMKRKGFVKTIPHI